MANKRETKRERRDEAKRRRLEELRRRQRKAQRRKIGIGAVIAAVIAGIILAVTLLGGEDVNPVAAREAGCDPVSSPTNEGSTHVAPPQTVNYRTIPPTSGNHYGNTAQTGIYDTPVQNEIQVHNLEHGHVVFHFQPGIDPAILQGIAEIVKDNRTYAILAPNPNMPFQLAFTAWGKLQGCRQPNVQAASVAREFFNAFKDKGPERGPRFAGQPRPADAPLPTGSPTATTTGGTPSPAPP
jgi:hypothetical protein